MKSGWRVWLWVGVAGICAARAFAVDTGWTNELQTMTFYEGDTNGTVCRDIFIDSALPGSNLDGTGLNLSWGKGSLGGQQPGYIRFENWLSKIPAGSFIYRADIILTASSNSTGVGAVLMGARGPVTYDETTVTWSTMPDWAAEVPYPSWFNYNSLWKRAFGTNLLAGTSITCNISPAARAWFDYYQNTSYGYTNAGVWMNMNAGGAGHGDNTESFYDSENGTPANRPHLVVQYLPPTANYKMYIYQATDTPTNTTQIMKVAAEDAYIQACWWNAQWFGLTNYNFGGVNGPEGLFVLDNALTNDTVPDISGVYAKELLRWRGFSYPPGVHHHVADAKLRLNTACNWNDDENLPAALQVEKIMKNWVEGVGVYNVKATPSTSTTNVTWCNYNAVPGDTTLTTNAWERHGASGPTDSTNLYTFSAGDQFGEMLSSDAGGLLAALVQDWLDGVGVNNGLALTTSATSLPIEIANFAHSGGPYVQTEPYHSAGLLIVFKKPVGSGVMLK